MKLNSIISKSSVLSKANRDANIESTIAQKIERHNKKTRVSVDNTIICSRAYTKEQLTRTSICDLALIKCCNQLNYVSVTDVANVIEFDFDVKNVAHKSDNFLTATRVRKHVKESLNKIKEYKMFMSYDESRDVIIFTDLFIELCRHNKAYKQKFNRFMKDVADKNFYQFS